MVKRVEAGRDHAGMASSGDRRRRYFGILSSLAVGAALSAPVAPAAAQTDAAADFYKGKTLVFLINFTPGGSTDVEGRIFAKHLAHHIPGHPSVVVQNMGGAGGSIGTNWVGQVARPDGLTLGYLTASTGKAALGEAGLKVDLNGFGFVGTVPDLNVTYMRTDVPPGIKAPADILKAKGFWIGGLTPDSPKDLIERMQLDLLGVDYKYLSGYKGSAEARLALQQNEIQFYNEGISAYRSGVAPGLVSKGEVIPLWYDPLDDGQRLYAAPEARDIPARPFHEFYRQVKGELPKSLLWDAYRRVNQLSTSFLRVFLMPPKTPPAFVATITRALRETVDDPAFKADAMATGGHVPTFLSGDTTLAAFREVLAPRPNVQTFLKDYIAKGFRTVGNKK
jgi:tripartite-type tricarboxylate transporter receptor subunit TctC